MNGFPNIGGAKELAERRPIIEYSVGRPHEFADRAEQILLDAGADIFQRAGHLVRPGYVEVPAADDRTTIVGGLYEVNEAALTEELARAAVWMRFDRRSNCWIACDPPSAVVRILAARRGQWKLRSVTGIITSPILRPDGTVVSAAGYDPITRLYHLRDATIDLSTMPESPTREDALRAVAAIDELCCESPFVNDSDRSVFRSLLISAAARAATGLAPVHAFTAYAPGSGKSYLCDIVAAVLTGRWCPVISPGRTEEEFEKRIGAMLLGGYNLISFDNISAGLGGDAMCQLAERPVIRIRILGKSETPECEFCGVVSANGNNLEILGDMPRRTLLGALDANMERPEERQFEQDPVRKVLANRGYYIGAALTIIRAYLLAKCPDKLLPLPSYERWSDTARSALVWLGCGDPVDTMEAARESNPELANLRSMLHSWHAVFGHDPTTCEQAVGRVASFDLNRADAEVLSDLRTAMVAVAGIRGVIDPKRLSYWLRGNHNRQADGLKFYRVNAGASHSVRHWAVVSVAAPRQADRRWQMRL